MRGPFGGGGGEREREGGNRSIEAGTKKGSLSKLIPVLVLAQLFGHLVVFSPLFSVVVVASQNHLLYTHTLHCD